MTAGIRTAYQLQLCSAEYVTVSRDLQHHRPIPVIATKASSTGAHPRLPSIDLLLEIFAAATGDEKLIKANIVI